MRVRTGSLALSLVAGATALALVAPTVGSADAAGNGPTYRQHDYADGQARYVLPPGENGLVNAQQALAFEATGQRPPHSQDQLGQYSNLLYGYPSPDRRHPREATSTTSPSGCRQADVTRTEHARDRRDDLPRPPGRPAHLRRDGCRRQRSAPATPRPRTGSSSWTCCATTARARWPTSSGRRATSSRWTTTSSCSRRTRRPRHNARSTGSRARYGAAGRDGQAMIDSYVAGVNAYIAAARTDPSLLPVDYHGSRPGRVGAAAVDGRGRGRDRRPDRRHLRQGRWLGDRRRAPADLPPRPLRRPGRRSRPTATSTTRTTRSPPRRSPTDTSGTTCGPAPGTGR